MWYYVCYDSQGDGFKPVSGPYCFAQGEDELKASVSYVMEHYAVDDDQVCIFELTDREVKATWSYDELRIANLNISEKK